MKCLILAAGYATRLYPLTENFPKPLLKVQGKTILDWLLEDLSGAVEEYIVVSNHKFARFFEEWAQEKRQAGFRVQVVDDGTSTNETRLGAVNDIRYAVETCGVRDDLLVLSGDNLYDFSLRRFLAYAGEKNAACTLRYYEASEARLKKSGVLTVAADDRILQMQEKPAVPATHWCCPAIYYFPAADLRRIPAAIAAGCGTDAPGSFLAWLIGETPVYAMEMPGSRYDIGDIESYRAVQETYRGFGA